MQYPFEFSCRRTGNCCARPEGVVRVDLKEIARIATYVGMTETAFRSRYLDARGDRLRQGIDSRCVFLEDAAGATCGIYEARPEKCATWPFWEELLEPAVLREAIRFCPGIKMRADAD